MTIFKKGDMLSPENIQKSDLTLLTTNATLNARDALVMGAGIARQARDRWPGLDLALGQSIRIKCSAYSPFEYRDRHYKVYQPPYNLIISPDWPRKKVGAFQVKSRFYIPASFDLISTAVSHLVSWCTEHPEAVVHLNFPGIGNGRLPRSKVLLLVRKLSDKVVIWEL